MSDHFDALKTRIKKNLERAEQNVNELRKQLAEIERLDKLTAPSQLDLTAESKTSRK